MNVNNNCNIASRYRTIRKHLDNLGYKQALSLDALPLIEKLLADLIQTTESLKHYKTIAQDNVEACSQLQLTVDPYKCDNARLTKECNQLHLDLIETKEQSQKQIKELKRQIYKLECECNDLQLASSCNLQKIKELETESSKKSKKILELQGKCLKPVISNVALATKKRACYPLRRPVLECDPLPTTKSTTSLPSLNSIEPKIIDLLSMADRKMACLNHEVTKLKGELSLQTDNVHSLKSQMATKEKEIMRLRKMLEGGRSYDAVSKDCSCKKRERNILSSHDSIEYNDIRALQQAKMELEQQLTEALNKQHDAMRQAMKLVERNEELEKELKDIDHIALAVEADCNSTVKENNRRVCRLQEKLEDVMTQVHVLENELTVERREVQELRADLEACRLEKHNIQRSLDNALDEKKCMTDKINRLTVIEKDLNDEIERLAKENESQKQDIIQLRYCNQNLKEQIHEKEFTPCSNRDELNQSKEKRDKNKGERTMRKECEETVQSAKTMVLRSGDNSNEDIYKEIREKERQIMCLRQTVDRLEAERDYYKTEYNVLKDQRDREWCTDKTELWTRTNELRHQLNEKDCIITKLEQERNELCRDKINLETQLQMSKNQQRNFCGTCRSCNFCKPHSSCICAPSLTSTGKDGISKDILYRLERERDTAKADVERLIEERDTLHERLKMAVEAHTCEQHRLREDLVEVETRLKHVEKERQDLLLTQATRRATINGLEEQLEDTREELKRTKQELAAQRTRYTQLRALQDQTDQALGDVQGQLGQSETELNKALDRNKSMQQQQIMLDNQIKELKEEINTLRARMASLDQEKDQFSMELDEKTEKIAALERELMIKEQQALSVEQQIRDLRYKNEICVDQSAEQERQMRGMQLEFENLRRQLDVATVDRENAIQENRKIQDDLAAVTCEVRTLQRELESSRAESYDLKKQLQTYVSEVRRAEELLNRKENERSEMLNHFRSLSLEATVLENNNHSLESEAAEARGALQAARDRLLDLERQLVDKDCLIRGYENQITELTQNVASMETQLRQQAEERQRAETDLTAIRDLCVTLDQQKDSLMHQLGDKDSLKVQYETQLNRLKTEQKMIKDQMERDRATVDRLESLLDQARQESINAQATNQELQNEMSRLKQKICELQARLSDESAELRQYQNQAAEYSKQISELRRQMTNERFDRARKEEESRRISKSTSTMLLQGSSTPIQAPFQPPTYPEKKSINTWNNLTAPRCFQICGRKECSVINGEKQSTNQYDMTSIKLTGNKFTISGAGANCRCLQQQSMNHTSYVKKMNDKTRYNTLVPHTPESTPRCTDCKEKTYHQTKSKDSQKKRDFKSGYSEKSTKLMESKNRKEASERNQKVINNLNKTDDQSQSNKFASKSIARSKDKQKDSGLKKLSTGNICDKCNSVRSTVGKSSRGVSRFNSLKRKTSKSLLSKESVQPSTSSFAESSVTYCMNQSPITKDKSSLNQVSTDGKLIEIMTSQAISYTSLSDLMKQTKSLNNIPISSTPKKAKKTKSLYDTSNSDTSKASQATLSSSIRKGESSKTAACNLIDSKSASGKTKERGVKGSKSKINKTIKKSKVPLNKYKKCACSGVSKKSLSVQVSEDELAIVNLTNSQLIRLLTEIKQQSENLGRHLSAVKDVLQSKKGGGSQAKNEQTSGSTKSTVCASKKSIKKDSSMDQRSKQNRKSTQGYNSSIKDESFEKANISKNTVRTDNKPIKIEDSEEKEQFVYQYSSDIKDELWGNISKNTVPSDDRSIERNNPKEKSQSKHNSSDVKNEPPWGNASKNITGSNNRSIERNNPKEKSQSKHNSSDVKNDSPWGNISKNTMRSNDRSIKRNNPREKSQSKHSSYVKNESRGNTGRDTAHDNNKLIKRESNKEKEQQYSSNVRDEARGNYSKDTARDGGNQSKEDSVKKRNTTPQQSGSRVKNESHKNFAKNTPRNTQFIQDPKQEQFIKEYSSDILSDQRRKSSISFIDLAESVDMGERKEFIQEYSKEINGYLDKAYPIATAEPLRRRSQISRASQSTITEEPSPQILYCVPTTCSAHIRSLSTFGREAENKETNVTPIKCYCKKAEAVFPTIGSNIEVNGKDSASQVTQFNREEKEEKDANEHDKSGSTARRRPRFPVLPANPCTCEKNHRSSTQGTTEGAAKTKSAQNNLSHNSKNNLSSNIKNNFHHVRNNLSHSIKKGSVSNRLNPFHESNEKQMKLSSKEKGFDLNVQESYLKSNERRPINSKYVAYAMTVLQQNPFLNNIALCTGQSKEKLHFNSVTNDNGDYAAKPKLLRCNDIVIDVNPYTNYNLLYTHTSKIFKPISSSKKAILMNSYSDTTIGNNSPCTVLLAINLNGLPSTDHRSS